MSGTIMVSVCLYLIYYACVGVLIMILLIMENETKFMWQQYVHQSKGSNYKYIYIFFFKDFVLKTNHIKKNVIRYSCQLKNKNIFVTTVCLKSTAAEPAPELVEVFVNDKPVYVEPGTTVLQVSNQGAQCYISTCVHV